MRISQLIKSAVASPSTLLKKVVNPFQHWVQSSFAKAKPTQKDKLAYLENRTPTHDAQLAKLHPDLAKVFGQSSTPIVVNQEAAKSQIYAKFAEDFANKAKNPQEFHNLLKTVYGPGYDKTQAEGFRQKALQGDFQWLPPIKFLGEKELGQANGAYDKEAGTIYLSEKLLADPQKAVATYTEEVGHHLDTKLKKSDTVGDEGEMFRRVMGGEKLTQAQIKEIRSDNDHGSIQVNGKTVEVEFWNPFKAVGKAIKSVGKGIKKSFQAIGSGIKNAAQSIGSGIKNIASSVAKSTVSIVTGLGKGLKNIGLGVANGLGGFFKNVFKGNFKEAFSSLWNGAKQTLIGGPKEIIKGIFGGVNQLLRIPSQVVGMGFNVAEDLFKGFTDALGPLGKPIHFIGSKFLGSARALVTGIHDTMAGYVKNVLEGVSTVGGGIEKIFDGQFKDGFKDVGLGFLKMGPQSLLDGVLIGGGKLVSAIQTQLGLEPVGRRLTEAEIAMLKPIYGNSIDYDIVQVKEGFSGLFSINDRAFVHGNTIYLKDGFPPKVSQKYFEETLAHEMMHVWQHQNGGTDYMSEALISQNYGKGYDWQLSIPGTSWSQLEPEQQAEFMGYAYDQGYFNPSSPKYGILTYNGQNLTAYLQNALAQIQAGEGAP